MRTLGWDEVTWDEFVGALRVYKERFAGKSGEDSAYIRCLRALEGLPSTGRAARAAEIVDFLNSWAARVSRADTSLMLRAWIREHAHRLDRLAGLTIVGGLAVDDIQELYASLMTAGRAHVRNWSDAANSKALHQLVPAVFVMWDNRIKQFAVEYGDFTREMYRFARRLIGESPYRSDRVELELQAAFQYSARKPLAKYLDEFNTVRASGVYRGAPGWPVA